MSMVPVADLAAGAAEMLLLAGALTVAAGLTVGSAAIRGWKDVIAALAASDATAAPAINSVPVRSFHTPMGDLGVLRQALSAERLSWVEAADGEGAEILVFDRDHRLTITLEVTDHGATAWLADTNLAAIDDTAARLALLSRMSERPEHSLDRLVRRYAAIKVAQELRKAGMQVQEEATGKIRATTVDEATGGTREVIFDAFGASAGAQLTTRHARPNGGAGPCSVADEALVHQTLAIAPVSNAASQVRHRPAASRTIVRTASAARQARS